MDQCCVGLELHARSGRPMLLGPGERPCEPRDLQLPSDLAPALYEWAQIVEAVRRTGDWDQEPAALVSQRGRLLAARLAGSTGQPVGYADPMAGRIEVLSPRADPEPTPWATGLAVSAVTAVPVGVALLALAEGLATIGTWAVVLGNLVVAGGLAPSIWLARAIPVWRWVAYGAVAGILLAWIVLLLARLGP